MDNKVVIAALIGLALVGGVAYAFHGNSSVQERGWGRTICRTPHFRGMGGLAVMEAVKAGNYSMLPTDVNITEEQFAEMVSRMPSPGNFTGGHFRGMPPGKGDRMPRGGNFTAEPYGKFRMHPPGKENCTCTQARFTFASLRLANARECNGVSDEKQNN